MKTSFLTLFFILIFSSCATAPLPTFKKEANCSPRALEKINQSKTLELTGQSNINAFKAAQSCYSSLISEGYDESHNICLVMEISKIGGLSFIDIADYSRPMGSELKTCILEKVTRIDFSDFKGQTILQPLRVDFPR